MAKIVSALDDAQSGSVDEDALLGLQLQLSSKIAQTDQRAADAKVERENRMADAPDPEPLVRTLRRLRHDIAILGRALSTPLPETAPERLRTALQDLLDALCMARRDGASVGFGKTAAQQPPGLDVIKAALGEYRASVGAGDPFIAIKKNEDVQRVFASLFMAEQTLQNAHDFADRAKEMAESRFEGRTSP
jgi:hypothetical protein